MAERQYTIKHTWRGLVVLVRYKVLMPYGFWEWDKWYRAGLDEQRDILERLSHG